MEKTKDQRIKEIATDYHELLQMAAKRREVLLLQTNVCITLQQENIPISDFMYYYTKHYVN